MTEVIVEVGPATIRGPNNARSEWFAAALDCIDDEIALIDDCPVSVHEVWRDVMAAVAGVDVDAVVLVCLGGGRPRVSKSPAGCDTVASTVVVLKRISMLRQGISPRTTIVELASEFVVVSALGMSLPSYPGTTSQSTMRKRWWRPLACRQRCWWTHRPVWREPNSSRRRSPIDSGR